MRPTQQAALPYVAAKGEFPASASTAVVLPASYDFLLEQIMVTVAGTGSTIVSLVDGSGAYLQSVLATTPDSTHNALVNVPTFLPLAAAQTLFVNVEGTAAFVTLAGYLLAPTAAALLPS